MPWEAQIPTEILANLTDLLRFRLLLSGKNSAAKRLKKVAKGRQKSNSLHLPFASICVHSRLKFQEKKVTANLANLADQRRSI